jgi:hypothetical protein
VPSRILSEDEFNAIKDRVLAAAPNNLSEPDFHRWIGPAMASAIGEAENLPPSGGGAGRFLGGAWKNLNPITALEGLYSGVTHPLDTGKAILQAQGAELGKAADNFKQGRYSEAVGHGAAGLLPLIGPAAAAAGERIGSGDVAGGLGEATGLLAPIVGPAAVRGASTAVRGGVAAVRSIPAGADALDAVANMADRASTARMVDVAAPKVGPNKLRLNRQMAKIAPDLVRDPELGALSRDGLTAKVRAKLADATAELDDAAATRPPSAQVPTAPIVQALDDRIAQLTAQPIDASRVVREVSADAPAVREVPLDPGRQYALRWIKEEMDALPFTKHNWTPAENLTGNAGGGHYNLAPGAAGAPIYREIVGGAYGIKATRGDVIQALNDLIEGKPRKGALADAIVEVADELADGKHQSTMYTTGPAPNAGDVGTRVHALSNNEPTQMPPMRERPLGQAVQSEANRPELETLAKIRNEVAQLGPVAPYESVRRIRAAWDQVAKPKYLPSTASDALKSQGEANAAMKGAGAIRDALAAADPVTAAANAKYSLFKSANDVLTATEETERARPRVLRGIVARTGGAMVGAESGGVIGAGAGVILGSIVERAAELAPTAKIVVARQLASVADLLRGGNAAAAEHTLRTIARKLPATRTANQVGQATSAVPQEPRTARQ